MKSESTPASFDGHTVAGRIPIITWMLNPIDGTCFGKTSIHSDSVPDIIQTLTLWFESQPAIVYSPSGDAIKKADVDCFIYIGRPILKDGEERNFAAIVGNGRVVTHAIAYCASALASE